jgi:putative hydroxymethylpyrimidine transporter CytX
MKKIPMLLLWLGAAISISEIFTGGLLAPLGFAKGFLAILLGHAIGVGLLALGGYVSFARGKNAMECVVFSFGSVGGKLIALCNVVQLVGWTIVMVVQAASAVTGVFPVAPFAPTALVLSVLVVAWALIFGSPVQRVNDVVVILLSILCAVLFTEALKNGVSALAVPMLPDDGMSFVLAVELSAAMPVSWLPLVGDYSAKADGKVTAALMPFAGYFTGSVLMYLFGLYIAVTSGGDIFAFIAVSRFRLVACAVVALSTLTTAFLDLYSAAVSSHQLVTAKNDRAPVLVIGALTLVAAVFFPIERYGEILTVFLSGIGMVFIPVYAVVFYDFVRKKSTTRAFPWGKLAIAVAVVIVYQFLKGSII